VVLTSVERYRGNRQLNYWFEEQFWGNGPEFVASHLWQWSAKLGIGTLYVEPRSPWENGYCEGFNGRLRDECLNGEIFYTLKEAQIVIRGTG
jgi:IS30 family transposase